MPAQRTKIDFYHDPAMPECRAVMLTAKLVDVELEYRLVDMKTEEVLNTAFERINPQRTIPTIIDKGFSLSESKAICAYLVNKYTPDSLIYPQRPENRAVIDQRLFFDNGSLTPAFHNLYDPYLYFGTPLCSESRAAFALALSELDKFLLGNHWVAGHHVTLADLCMVCVVNSAEACQFELDSFKSVAAWLERCKASLPGYKEVNEEGLNTLAELLCEAKINVPPEIELEFVDVATTTEEEVPDEEVATTPDAEVAATPVAENAATPVAEVATPIPKIPNSDESVACVNKEECQSKTQCV